MNNLVTLCVLLATAVYLAKAYDFQDSDFNQLLSADFEEGIDSLNDVPSHPRARRDEEATLANDDKCKKRHRRPKLCCAEETLDTYRNTEKQYVRDCFKQVLGVEKHGEKNGHSHKRSDLFSCEEVEKRKNDMLCVQQCIGQKKGLLADDGTPKPEEIAKQLKESFAKESWFESVVDKVMSNCLAEARNATEKQVKPTFDSIKACNPSGMTLKHCLFREIQLSCPADQIKDKAACDRFQERVKKGENVDEPVPPYDEPKDE